ncbi:hypothetical protein L873DRAFT_1261469 [Choiromyces venosus 120613-1]|uniref:Zn(2)-C6 fungal-type domain-containing protein n=1 Tax=Choiromyces venosus 120613-1 TaxID=1336337 RepID=A0A3N4JCR8_9PEZI|nr:hypothetical protein L873DRAFT_1261469 [Choiromyces venosus 120613-1]
MPARERAPTACDNCCTRETKCDNSRPACGNCAKSGIECSYSGSEEKELNLFIYPPCGRCDCGMGWGFGIYTTWIRYPRRLFHTACVSWQTLHILSPNTEAEMAYLEQRLYWTCLKASCELRAKLSLPVPRGRRWSIPALPGAAVAALQ